MERSRQKVILPRPGRVLQMRHSLAGLAKDAVLDVSVSLNVCDLLISFTVPLVLSSWFPTLLSFVSFQSRFRFRSGFRSGGKTVAVRDCSICTTVVAVFHPFVVCWLRLLAFLVIDLV